MSSKRDATEDSDEEEVALSKLHVRAKKRARASNDKKTEVHISQLPSDVLVKIFSHLSGTTLGRAESVCRRWHAEICDRWNSAQLWRTMCEKRGLEMSKFRRADRERLKERMDVVARTPHGTPAQFQAVGLLARAWRRMFINYRCYICRHCLKYEKRNQCRLFGNLRLCKKCRFKMPYASLLTTQARRYFKFDTVNAEAVLGYELNTATPLGGGTLYRFSDVQKFAELKFGKEWAEKKAKQAKKELGIGQMTGTPLLNDV